MINLHSSSPGRSGVRAGGGWRWNLNPTKNSPVAPCELGCQISTSQHEAEKSANVNKHWKKKGAKGSDVFSSVIYTNQHFASTFLMQIFKFQRHSCKLSFLFLHCHQSALENLFAGYTMLHRRLTNEVDKIEFQQYSVWLTQHHSFLKNNYLLLHSIRQ